MKFLGVLNTSSSGSTTSCPQCNGTASGDDTRSTAQIRYAHYATFGSTESLATHLRATGPAEELWLNGVLSWHRNRLLAKSAEAKRDQEISGKALAILIGGNDEKTADETGGQTEEEFFAEDEVHTGTPAERLDALLRRTRSA